MSKIKVLLWFDVEDYITPEADDALLAILELLEAKGIKGTFKLVGEKARVLKERGRQDILAKLSKQDVGYHTDMHSKHPTVSEYLEYMNFREGASCFEEKEQKGSKDVVDISGRKASCYGQAGASWAPQVYPVLKRWEIPVYLDVHKIIDVYKKPFWFGGLLNLTSLEGLLRMELVENGLEEGKKEFDKIYEKFIHEDMSFVSIYYHPCEFATTEFWDGCNYSSGENTPQDKWNMPHLRSKEEMKYYIEKLGLFIDYILSKSEVGFITASTIPSLESSSNEAFPQSQLKDLAEKVTKELYFHNVDKWNLCASEIYSLLYKYLLGIKLEPELLYGPEALVKSECLRKVKVSELKKAIDINYMTIYGVKQLPNFFIVNGEAVNPVDMACTLAEVIAKGLEDSDELEIKKGILKSQIHVNENEDWGKDWVIFAEDFKVPNIIAITKLQSWTIKPAMF
jgi:hypothetical protein